jgi:hypothetical protein
LIVKVILSLNVYKYKNNMLYFILYKLIDYCLFINNVCNV